MPIEVRPEPTDAEREALLAALGNESEPADPYRSAWRHAAITGELSVEDGDTFAQFL